MAPYQFQPVAIAPDAVERLRLAAAQFMTIHDTTVGEGRDFAVRFRGQLSRPSMEAYDQARATFGGLGFTPLFRKDGQVHVVLALPGLITPRPSRVAVNLVMFGLTVVSVLFAGGLYGWDGPVPATAGDWVRLVLAGWPYLLSLLGILLAHEFGHYFAARYHKVDVTLPYFIPLPFSQFGTMGAFIQLKSPPTNKRVLLDIGVAGPLAGLVVAIPVLIFGLATSALGRTPTVIPPEGIGMEGNSILYAAAKFLVFGRLLPAPPSFEGVPPLIYMLRYYVTAQPAPLGWTDVFLNDVAWAGWAGLLVTGLNLIPAGQLDGGHALYVLLGRRARRVLPLILLGLLMLGVLWTGWLLYAALIYFLGRVYAEPLDQITEVDPARKLIAIGVLIIFVLVFTPIPLTAYAR